MQLENSHGPTAHSSPNVQTALVIQREQHEEQGGASRRLSSTHRFCEAINTTNKVREEKGPPDQMMR